MSLRVLVMLFAAALLFSSLVSLGTASGNLAHGNRLKLINSGGTCMTENQVTDELNKLSLAPQYADQADIVNLLLRDARKSEQCRKVVIAGIVKTMDKAELDLSQDPPTRYLWHYGSEILAALKASEALDFLIAHLDVDDGSDFPLSHHPAMVAVVEMGKIAIPKLTSALPKTADPSLRRHIVFCLGWLGGPSARKAIERALSVETDACASKFMRSTLAALKNKKQSNQITSSDRLRWYASFRCDVSKNGY